MVYSFSPQGKNASIVTNTNYPPQDFESSGGRIPVFNDEAYVSSGDRGSSAYVASSQRGKVDYEDVI